MTPSQCWLHNLNRKIYLEKLQNNFHCGHISKKICSRLDATCCDELICSRFNGPFATKAVANALLKVLFMLRKLTSIDNTPLTLLTAVYHNILFFQKEIKALTFLRASRDLYHLLPLPPLPRTTLLPPTRTLTRPTDSCQCPPQ